jgi:probable poly-beta-1,6-N-acetyl-D-glucosamine export protein
VVIEQRARKPHVYELDPLRGATALGVVAVHVVSFTVMLNHSDAGVQIQNALVVALHFTRAVFMFLTAFAMVYVYYGKPFAFKGFWKKRSLGVLLPYCIWSLLYVWENTPGKTPLEFMTNVLSAIATGNASYQMYYILLTLQFYLVLPVFLLFLKHVAHHPWRVFSISFVLQVVMFFVDYQFLQQGTLATSGIWYEIVQFQDRFVLTYQFYFVVGGLTALYFQQIRSFLLRNGVVIFCGFLVSLAVLWIHFALQVRVYQEPMAYVTSVLQPVMVFYSLAVIACSFWLTCLWAKRRKQNGQPKGYRFWHQLSDASFGVYLLHAFLLTALLKWIVPAMPSVWPVAIRVFLTWFFAAGGAAVISVILLHIPVLSRLVGREHAGRRKAEISKHLSAQQQDARFVEEPKQEQHAL